MISPFFLAGALADIALMLFCVFQILKAYQNRDAGNFKMYMVFLLICVGIIVAWVLNYKYFSV